MQLLIPPEIKAKLITALAEAGRREIGGILMGEHVGPETFRVKQVTIQRHMGTFATFVRLVTEFLAPLRSFFVATNHEYTKFNYLGEWHSHPSFALSPSQCDHKTMYDIVTYPQMGARFVVLLLVKLGADGQLNTQFTVYRPNEEPLAGAAFQESSSG